MIGGQSGIDSHSGNGQYWLNEGAGQTKEKIEHNRQRRARKIAVSLSLLKIAVMNE